MPISTEKIGSLGIGMVVMLPRPMNGAVDVTPLRYVPHYKRTAHRAKVYAPVLRNIARIKKNASLGFGVVRCHAT